MATTLEYALLAGVAYRSTRDPINRLPIPTSSGWSEILNSHRNLPVSGFEAISFQRGTEIVISFSGTGTAIDWLANAGLAAGTGSAQLLQAAEYYLQVKALNPKATITLTGHSLGGGLAALIGVFFGVEAKTFDQAPFAQTARFKAADLLNELVAKLDANGNRLYSDAALSGLSNYIQLQQANGGIPNSGLVTNINVQGEFLSSAPFNGSNRIGATIEDIANSSAGVVGSELHAQALLTAFLQSRDTADTGKTLNDVTYKLTDLLGMIFDKNLFAHDTDPNTTDENFLERLVKHEAGNAPGVTDADAMLTRFTRDLWKLAQDGGLTLLDGNTGNPDLNEVSKALTAFAMQMYYEDTANATNAGKELFTTENITGGIRFDLADVSTKIKAALETGEAATLSDAKGYDLYFSKYLLQEHAGFTAEESHQIKSWLPYMRDWYVQAGASGMNATDTLNRGAFMLGGNGADTLTGGTAADLLVGNAGEDALNGGAGNDILLGGAGNDTLKGDDGVDMLLGGSGNDTLDGGAGTDILKGGDGNDTYAFTGSYGTDIVTDSDGSGSIQVDGKTLGGATQAFESIYKDAATGHTFVRLNGGNSLVILKEGAANRILVNDWPTAGSLGISLQGNTPAAPAATITGDFKKMVDDHGTPDTSDDTYVMTDDNYTQDGDEANALDLISGTAGNDVIDGKGGDDALSGMAGDDYIEGGIGSDVIQGGLGKDTINGGAGDDTIYGSSDMVIDKPTNVDFTKPVNDYPHPSATGFNWTAGYYDTYSNGVPDGYSNAPRNRLADDQGNLIDGGAGDDFIAAGTGADYVHGGDGKDFIFGMDKDDILFGGGDNDLIYGDGNKQSNTSVVWSLPENHGNDIIDGGDGNDYLFGQGKDDIIFGGIGNDVIWGDDEEADLPVAFHGNDFLFGGAGSDSIIGGAGDDYLEGGTGDDTIWGGTGNDIYFFNAGDGVDTLYDQKVEGEKNIIRFGEGVDASKVKLRLGSLLLDLGNGDVIHIGGFDQNDVFNSSSISSFEFADGSALTTTELLARGFDLDGTAGSDTIIGTNTTDRINGLDGNDTLVGGAGKDIIHGGAGNDLIAGDNGGYDTSGEDDIIDGGDGNDQIDAQGGDDKINGGAGNDLIAGGLGDDTLDGGVGADTLYGGAGDDTYVVDNAADIVMENVNEGVDTVQSCINYTLGNNLENLTLTGTSMINGKGNELDNVIIGNTGHNVLQGFAGNDIYRFKLGDGQDEIYNLDTGIGHADTIKFDDVASTGLTSVIRSGSDLILNYGATDSITISHQFLSSDYQVNQFQFSDGVVLTAEQLYLAYPIKIADAPNNITSDNNDVLIGSGGNDTLLGGTGNDRLYGGNGDDILNGEAGDDLMMGGLGDDTYFVDSLGDLAIENSGPASLAQYEKVTGGIHLQGPYQSAVAISGDGRYVVFNDVGIENGFVLPGYNLFRQLFVKDTQSGNVSLVTGVVANSDVDKFSISANGRYVSFQTRATNLVSGAGNDHSDIFVRDLVTGQISLVSKNLPYYYGPSGNSEDAVISANGRYVAFSSYSRGLVYGSSGGSEVYIRDMQTEITSLVSTAANNSIENGWSYSPSISADGRFVAFTSSSSNLLTGDNNGNYDIFVKDTITGVVSLISTAADSAQGNGDSFTTSMSADGRYVAFVSSATNLVAGDTNGVNDIFVKDIKTGAITLVSSAADGAIGNGSSRGPVISPDGRFVAFDSSSNNLVPGDPGPYGGTYIKDLQTGNIAWLTIANVTNVNTPVAFSSDAWRIAFASNGLEFGGVTQSTGGTLLTDNYFLLSDGNSSGGIDSVVASISHVLGEGIENLTLSGNESIDATGNNLNNILTGNGADNILTGGGGNDTLVGNNGNDRYEFQIGNGQDIVDNSATDNATAIDTLFLGEGITTTSVALTTLGEDLVVKVNATDSITIRNYFSTLSDQKIDQIEFGDGTVWDQATIESNIGAGNDILTGTSGNDTLHGYGGNDTISGGDGDDRLYGDEGNDTLNGDGGNDLLDGGSGADKLKGGVGDDVYVIDNVGDVVIENANEGLDTVQSAITLTLGSNLENLTLTGSNAINGTGNTLDNTLIGNNAANILKGGGGNDTYYVGAGDTVTESASQGTDTVISEVTFTLGSNLENLTLTGTAAINGTGNTLSNLLIGNGANNILSGGTGADIMKGGAGNDTYVVDNALDVVTENFDEGADLIQSSVTYTLAANLENLTLTGTSAINGTGNTLDNVLTGNSAVNTLTGGAGNDRLDGKAGADKMFGGTGDDTYVVSISTDVITENANEGIDSVESSVTLTLGANVENLTLTGTTAINGTGNTLNNLLKGNGAANSLTGAAGNDTLDGMGGSDTLTGGTGNDTYIMGRGYGTDTAVENDTTAGNTDIAQFLSGVTADQIWFKKATNNLEVSIIGTSDKLVVKDWYLGSAYRVEQFKTTDGALTLLDSQIENLVSAMASFAPPAAGQTTLPPAYQTSLNTVIAANWQ